MRLLDPLPLEKLRDEFRLSMRQLFVELCRELHADHVALTRKLSIPTAFLGSLRSEFPPDIYSNWKVVGWIETLNDLVYLLDVIRQFEEEQDRPEFAEQLLAECQEKFLNMAT